MKKRVISIILALILLAVMAGPALAEGNASGGYYHTAFIRSDGSLWVSGLAELVDGTGSSG